MDKKTLVFVEVKYRSSNTFGSAVEAVTPQKMKRIYKSAMAYLSKTQIKYQNYRIDVIAIDTNEKHPLQHFTNIGF